MGGLGCGLRGGLGGKKCAEGREADDDRRGEQIPQVGGSGDDDRRMIDGIDGQGG